MSYWFYLNAAMLIFAGWHVIQHYYYPTNISPIIFGFLGLLFFLFNWTRHAVFSTIRNSSSRPRKIKLVNISKKIRPFHRWVGTLALVMVIGHAYLIIDRYGFHLTNLKMLFGFIAMLIFIALVVTGWYRLVKPSGKIRRLHLRLGFLLFAFIALHLIF